MSLLLLVLLQPIVMNGCSSDSVLAMWSVHVNILYLMNHCSAVNDVNYLAFSCLIDYNYSFGIYSRLLKCQNSSLKLKSNLVKKYLKRNVCNSVCMQITSVGRLTLQMLKLAKFWRIDDNDDVHNPEWFIISSQTSSENSRLTRYPGVRGWGQAAGLVYSSLNEFHTNAHIATRH